MKAVMAITSATPTSETSEAVLDRTETSETSTAVRGVHCLYLEVVSTFQPSQR
jgi:hypothetical protein